MERFNVSTLQAGVSPLKDLTYNLNDVTELVSTLQAGVSPLKEN